VKFLSNIECVSVRKVVCPFIGVLLLKLKKEKKRKKGRRKEMTKEPVLIFNIYFNLNF